MKRLCRSVLPVMILIFFLFPALLFAEEGSVMEPDLSLLEDAVAELDKALSEMNPDFSLEAVYHSILHGDFSFDLKKLFSGLLTFLCGEIRTFSALFAQLILLGLAGAVFQVFAEGLGNGSVAKVGQWVIYLAFLLVAVKALRLGLDLGAATIRQAADFLYAILPILLGSFALTGGTVAAAVVQPGILMAVTIFLGFTERFFLPMLLILAALGLCSHLSSHFSFGKLFELIRDVILIGLGLMMTVFTGVIGLSGFAAGTVDGLTMKTVKMATGNFIPVIGSYLADAFDSILGAGMLLRSTIGIFGIAAVAMIVILPGLRILLMALLFKIAAALLQPFGDNEYVGALSDFSTVLTVLFAVVAAAGLLFFFLIFCIIGVSSMTMMLR